MQYYLKCWQNYAGFGGRAGTDEFWWFSLCHVVVFLLCYAAGSFMGESGLLLPSLYFWASLVPFLAVQCRRAHDIGRSGWLLLWHIIPILGQVVLFLLFSKKSKPVDNRYGAYVQPSES